MARALAELPDCLDADGCGLGTPQFEWLRADLEAHPPDRYPCTLAFWHDPRFLWVSWWQQDGRPRGPQPHVRPLWGLLQDWDAEVVLGGNAHNYERWLPQDAGIADAEGSPNSSSVPASAVERSRSRASSGTARRVPGRCLRALRLTLGPVSTSWSWRSAAGEPPFQDEGTAACH